MPTYSYQAFNESGSSVAGQIEAESAAQAEAKLSAMGYIPVSIAEGVAGVQAKRQMSLWQQLNRKTKVTPQELILFTKQFRTMLSAGLPLTELLQVLEQQAENDALRDVCATMGDNIKKGMNLTEAFRQHPKIFNELYVSMISAGEMAGSLPEVMTRLNYIIAHEQKVRSDIRSALQYPIIVLIALAMSFFVLLTKVIPQFAEIFKSSRIELPVPTVIAMAMSDFIRDYWYLLIGGLVAGVIALRMYARTENGKIVLATFWLKLPLLGPLFVKASMSRFSSIFSILQSSGVSILTAMDILTGTIGNAAIAKEFSRLKNLLSEGQGISGPLRRARYFTPMIITMVAIGEETGKLDDLLKTASEHYDEEVAYAVSRLSGALGPILMVGLSGVVGFFALAIFLPMWDLTKMVQP